MGNLQNKKPPFRRQNKKPPPIRSDGEWGAQPLIGLSIGVYLCFTGLPFAVTAGAWVIRGISNP